MWKRVLALGLAAGGVVGLSSCGGSNDPLRNRQSCLYAAVQAYPTWPDANGLVLENVAECKKLPPKERVELRNMMTAFVNRAQERSRS